MCPFTHQNRSGIRKCLNQKCVCVFVLVQNKTVIVQMTHVCHLVVSVGNFKSFVYGGSQAVACLRDAYEHAHRDYRAVWLCMGNTGIDVMALYRHIHHFHGVAMWISSDIFYHNDGMRTILRHHRPHPTHYSPSR